MSLAEILNEIVKLTPGEKQKVREKLEESCHDLEASPHERQEQLLQKMLSEGFLKYLPTRKLPSRKSRPVPIKGKPLSETIIEERR